MSESRPVSDGMVIQIARIYIENFAEELVELKPFLTGFTL
jgi:hypothetical protein